MDLKEILKQFNLNKKEASIYLAALELGTTTASEIAKKAQIQRTYFYDLSNRLIELGLFRQVRKEKKRMFIALKPRELLELQQHKLKQLEKALPEFEAIHNTSGQKPKVFYYDGLEGMTQINHDALKYKGERVAFTTPSFWTKEQEKIGNEFMKQRAALSDSNRLRIISEVSQETIDLKKRDKKELRETRMLPSDVFNSKVAIKMYGNHTSIVDYKENFGFIIESSEIAKTLKMIFEIIWSSGKIIE